MPNNITCRLLIPDYTQFRQKILNLKAVPLQAWRGPEDSWKLKLPEFVTTALDGGRLSALRTGRL